MSRGTIDDDNNNKDFSVKKRIHTEELNLLNKKKVKRSTDISAHWKKIQTINKTNTPQIFECNSKNNYLIITDPLGERSCFIISKSSAYWFNESIRLMQQHVEYGTTLNATTIGEIIEIERNLKALKANLDKNGWKKTFFFRAEALINFIRLCCTFFDNPLEKFRLRLHALFDLCASCWLHMMDMMLPSSIVRVEQNFVFDDDYGDFENDSILRYFRKDDQTKIQKLNNQIPNLRQILYTIIVILEKFNEIHLINRIYLERFQMIYEIWIVIDNELNSRVAPSVLKNSKKKTTKQLNKISWDFLEQCQKYEQTFGKFTSNTN